MKAEYVPDHVPSRKYVMCHMVADTDEELFEMVDKIGVSRRWHQGDHFDITQSKKRIALQLGAVPIPLRTLALMMAVKRKTGKLPSPEEAAQEHRRLRERREE